MAYGFGIATSTIGWYEPGVGNSTLYALASAKPGGPARLQGIALISGDGCYYPLNPNADGSINVKLPVDSDEITALRSAVERIEEWLLSKFG